MEKENAPVDVRKNLRKALFKSLVVPVLTLIFFFAAPRWLDHKLHQEVLDSIQADPNYSPEEKLERVNRIAGLDFEQICLACPPDQERLHARLEKAGVVANFQRLRWGFQLAVMLVIVLGAAVWAIFGLNKKAGQSQTGLIRGYRWGWRISMAAALVAAFLLTPLLAYGTFEFSVLATNHYLPKLLILIVLGGLIALGHSVYVLLKKIPLEFSEPMAREISPAEAPELWQAVRAAAARLQTSPPDGILIGLQLNFYVTELAVKYEGGKTEGKTLFLSLPVLKQLSETEVIAIIGHELGHFIGEDTKMTREFYPLRLKVRGTMIAMARSGLVGWPSAQFLNFFAWCFGETERTASRSRELLADRKAAELTAPLTAARALVRFQVVVEAFQRSLKMAGKNPLDIPLHNIVREKLLGEPAFWTQLFEKKLPHPLDTHPPLHIRLESLGQTIGTPEAQAMAQEKTESAYDQWLASHADLFTSLNQQATVALAQMQSRAELVQADYETASGREFLDRQFPEKKWRVRPAVCWLTTVLLGLLSLICLTVAAFGRDRSPAPLIIFSLLALLFAVLMVIVFLRQHNGELILTAEGLRHSGWKRPLLFKDVNKITAHRNQSNLNLIFHLKAKQPSLWKFSLLRIPRLRFGFSISGLEDKPAVNADIIYRYFTRQLVK